MQRYECAPIVIFVYNRIEHTKKAIRNLALCELAEVSDLYIYSDGAKFQEEEAIINEIRDYCSNVNGFNSVKLNIQINNIGLAANIIEGVTDVINKHDKVIVLEDDLLVDKDFLVFMNNSLDFYRNEEHIWHISGWNYPIDTTNLEDVFLTRIMNCWGWATWKEKWMYFEKNPTKLIEIFNKDMIRDFDVNNSGVFWNQVLNNASGNINTWAIFWYATIFLNKGLCVNPSESLVTNNGHDGSGTHKSSAGSVYSTALIEHDVKNWNLEIKNIQENEIALFSIIKFYKDIKGSILKRSFIKIKLILGF